MMVNDGDNDDGDKKKLRCLCNKFCFYANLKYLMIKKIS